MPSRSTTLAAAFLCWGFPPAPAGAQPTPRAFVLDAGANALVVLDLASGKRAGHLPLPGTPTRLQLSEDGRYVVVLDPGPGEDKDERGYKATGRSSATVVETTGLKLVGRVELGFGLDSVVTVPEGRLVVTCPGYEAKNPAESLVRELIVVDLASARETGRLALEPGTDLTWYSPDGRALALLQGLPRTARYPFPKSKVTFVDVAGPSVTGTLDAGGWNFVERDADRVYLIDHGRPDKNPQKNRNGAIDVVRPALGTVDHVDIGRRPLGVLLGEGGLVVVASEGPPGGSAGELRLLREGRLAATLPVASRPTYVAPWGKDVFVVGSKAVTIVDPARLEVTANIPLARGTEPIVDDDDMPFEMAMSPDARRAFIHYPAQDKVAVLDLEQGKAIGSTKTGRGGKKFLNSMMAGLTYGLSSRIYYYSSSDPPQMQVRPDGRFAYVLNLDTSDITVVDAETAAAVGKIAGGGREVRLLGKQTIAVVGPEIHLIDASRNVKVDDLRLPGLRGLLPSPDGAFAVALAKGTVSILDGGTGQERARLTDFVNPIRLAFAPAVTPTPAP